MATIKFVIFKGKQKENGECRVYCQLAHKRQTSCIPTNVYVQPEHFSATRVVSGRNGDKNAITKNTILNNLENLYLDKIYKLGDKANSLDIKTLRKYVESNAKDLCLTDFCRYTEKRLSELKTINKTGTITPLTTCLQRVREFFGESVDFADISVKRLNDFVSYYQNKGYKKNSIASYLTYIRTMFNDAIDEYNTDIAHPVITNYPFRRFKIEREITANRNLAVKSIIKIRDAELPTYKMQCARDVFMLQIYLMGINTKDIFYLTKNNLLDGRLKFDRHKTGHKYNIKVEPEAMSILEKHKGEKYLLWFGDNSGATLGRKHTRKTENQYSDCRSFNKMINQQLSKIAEYLELSSNLTSYYSRHSFATIMREIGISKDDISLCLGHKDPEQNLQVSNIYINEDFVRADNANRMFIDYLNSF